MQTKNLDLYLIPHIKIILKQIIDFSVKSKTVKLLEENIKENLCDLWLNKVFLNKTQKAIARKKKRQILQKLKTCAHQDTIKK